jgi:hypothetical protein
MMSNANHIQRFESDAISSNAFHHSDHVRVALAYLSQYTAFEALARFTAALKRFAAAHGKPQLYHETITHAYSFLIREGMARCSGADWGEFARQNPDLLTWKDGILNRYYQEATLKSDCSKHIRISRQAADRGTAT